MSPKLAARCRAIENGEEAVDGITSRTLKYLYLLDQLADEYDDGKGWILISQQEIAKRMGVHSGGVVCPNINKLIKAGMIERRQRPRKGRFADPTPDRYRVL